MIYISGKTEFLLTVAYSLRNIGVVEHFSQDPPTPIYHHNPHK